MFQNERTVYLFPAAIKEIGGDKWGYINAKGKLILPPIYENAGDFQDNGLAIVRVMDHAGVINSSGYFIVKPKYDTINPFSEGRATVIDHQGFKVIDESGKEITSKAYSYIGDYKESRALIADNTEDGRYLYGYLNKRGKEVISLTYEYASDFKDGKAVVKTSAGSYELIDKTGKVLKRYPYIFVGNYGQGRLAFQKEQNGKFGYIDEQGTIVIEPKFSGAQPFIQNRAVVNVLEDFKDHYGLINLNGLFTIKPNYNRLDYLEEDRYAIGKAINPAKPYAGSKYAVADADGRILTGFIYNEVTTYNDGVASASNDQNTFFIDKSGQRVKQLPIVSGSGRLHFEKTIIKGEIDFRLIYLSKNGDIVWKQNTVIPLNNQYAVLERKYKPNKDYLVYFPQLEGTGNDERVNATLKEISGVKAVPSHTQLESNYMGDFDVTFFKKNLLVIEIHGYDYPFGASHGMPVKRFAHINLKTGSLFDLQDLFKPGSPYVKKISEIIGNQIKSNPDYSYVFPNSYKGIQAKQPFFISDKGLNIYFSPYEIAPFAAGFPTFTIPFEKLMNIINQSGEFWDSFHT
ncbi:WG repeat-containing protein [Neobacillus pocheonensis]|uniref:WG repeat-containing protein n=1 Tax=Neobacillus pocheonensis TaxID=363869 RepID=UPI003D2C67E2